MRRRIGVFAPVLFLGVVGCGADDGAHWGKASNPLKVCDDCDEIVLGRDRYLDADGKLVTEAISGQPSPDLWDRLQQGFAQDGRRYISVLGGTWDGEESEHRFQYLTLSNGSPEPTDLTLKPLGIPVGATPPKALSTKLALAIAENPTGVIDVFIDAAPEPQTSLAPHPSVQFDWLSDAEKQTDTSDRIADRDAEVTALLEPLREALETSGAENIEALWLTGNMYASVPAQEISKLLARSDVKAIELIEPVPAATADVWDGQDMKSPGGMSTQQYMDWGYTGYYTNPNTGHPIRVAIVDESFDYNHPALLDVPGGATRLTEYWNCVNNPCTWGSPYPPTGQHGSVLTGLASGDLRDEQMVGADDWQLDRTGVAEEVRMMVIDIGANGAGSARGIQRAVTSGADVIVFARRGVNASCDGNFSDFDEAIWQAHSAGKLVVSAAGNAGHPGSGCTLEGGGDNMAGFLVGSLGETQTSVTDQNYYISSDVSTFSSRGGIDVTINGSSYTGAVTGISALTPGCPNYKMIYDDDWFLAGACGTSYAVPQVGGAAALVEHYFLQSNGSYIVGGNGRLFTALLAMTDRANGPSTKLSSGFDKLWGGGRLQSRLYIPQDMGNVIGWMFTTFTMSHGQTQDLVVNGTGNEPVSLNQFKAYAVFFEQDNQNIADIDLRVLDQNCGGGSAVLGYDVSRDTKSMVRLSGQVAANKALCVRLQAYYVPAGETRQVVLFTYYSAATTGR